MTRSQAAQLVTMLVSAYPQWNPDRTRVELYVARIAEFDFEAGRRAIEDIIDLPREWPPSLGLIATQIRAIQWRLRDERKALPPPLPSPEQRKRNQAKLRAIIDDLAHRWEMKRRVA